MDRRGAISVYSQDLDLIVRSDATSLGAVPGLLPPVDEDDSTLLFNSPEGSFLFTTKLRPIARLPQQADYAAAAETTPDGRMTVLVTSGLNRYQMVRLHRRSWFEYLSIFYLDYQYYVLALLTSLGVGLIIVNYYRYRVTSQKKALETVHAELASIHEQLKRTQQQLIEAEKYRQAQDIAGGFAHEIRNALFPAESALKKIRQGLKSDSPDPAYAGKLAETSVKAVERALDVTDLISQYTRLENELEREQVLVTKVVREMLTANETRISEQQVTVSVAGAVDCTIDINPLHFYMILNNLLLNSLDALTERPERVILIAWEKCGDRLQLSFSDTGSGISASDRARIFQPFFSTKPNRGTGLGLAIIQRLITIYHGEISVESEAGRGTIFVATLPIGETRQSTTDCPT
jgi:signal transduction histidine kinase